MGPYRTSSDLEAGCTIPHCDRSGLIRIANRENTHICVIHLKALIERLKQEGRGDSSTDQLTEKEIRDLVTHNEFQGIVRRLVEEEEFKTAVKQAVKQAETKTEDQNQPRGQPRGQPRQLKLDL